MRIIILTSTAKGHFTGYVDFCLVIDYCRNRYREKLLSERFRVSNPACFKHERMCTVAP